MRALLIALLLPITTIACDTKPEVKPEVKAEVAKTGEAKTGEVKTSEPAATIEEQNKATDVEQAKGAAKTEVAIVKEAADKAVVPAHKIAHDKLQSDFDDADRKFIALKEQVATATGAKKKNADAAVAEVTKREATVMAGIAKLRDATGAQWDATKTQVDADALALDKAIVALETSLK